MLSHRGTTILVIFLRLPHAIVLVVGLWMFLIFCIVFSLEMDRA